MTARRKILATAATITNTSHNSQLITPLVGFIERLLKWKARWAILSGLFTLILIPLVRWIIGKANKPSGAAKKGVVDADYTEIKQ